MGGAVCFAILLKIKFKSFPTFKALATLWNQQEIAVPFFPLKAWD